MMKRLLITGTAVLSLLVSYAGASTSLLENGSFELSALTQSQANELERVGQSYASLEAGSTSLTGWTIGGTDIDYIRDYWVASEGSYSLDLNGDEGAGSISQSFDTVIGETYEVVFDMAGNPDGYQNGVDAMKSLLVSAAEDSKEFSFDTTETNLTNMGWQQQTWTFMATETTTTLTFTSLETGERDNGYGAALDNVAVYHLENTVPVPGAILLTGIGITGLTRMRRKLRYR